MEVRSVDYKRFREDLDGAINSVIQRILGDNLYNWDEDYITQELLREYRQRFQNIEIRETTKKKIVISSNAYKLRKKLLAEQKFGDIALIVRIQYSDHLVEGVAFLEAKKRTEKSRAFSAIKDEQLGRIYKNAPHACLLLYDYESIHDSNDYKLQSYRARSSGSLHAVTLPISVAIGSKLKDTKLYRFSHPLSHQILTRYFCGLDLEFNQEALDIAKGYDRNTGSPQFLLVVSVVPSNRRRGDISQFFEQRAYNDNVFEEI
jgi:hypothetical protein